MKEFRVKATVDIHLIITDDELDLHTVLNEMEYEFTPSPDHKQRVSITYTDMWDYISKEVTKKEE
jgi:hypothetical protein